MIPLEHARGLPARILGDGVLAEADWVELVARQVEKTFLEQIRPSHRSIEESVEALYQSISNGSIRVTCSRCGGDCAGSARGHPRGSSIDNWIKSISPQEANAEVSEVSNAMVQNGIPPLPILCTNCFSRQAQVTGAMKAGRVAGATRAAMAIGATRAVQVLLTYLRAQ